MSVAQADVADDEVKRSSQPVEKLSALLTQGAPSPVVVGVSLIYVCPARDCSKKLIKFCVGQSARRGRWGHWE